MMISVRAGRSFWTAFRDTIVRFALRRPFAGVASPGARRMSPSAIAWKALHDVAFIGQAAAEQVSQDRGCVAGNRYGCVHGAVSFMLVIRNGGGALPRTSDRRSASGQVLPLEMVQGVSVDGDKEA